jgi:hypothetical protein
LPQDWIAKTLYFPADEYSVPVGSTGQLLHPAEGVEWLYQPGVDKAGGGELVLSLSNLQKIINYLNLEGHPHQTKSDLQQELGQFDRIEHRRRLVGQE